MKDSIPFLKDEMVPAFTVVELEGPLQAIRSLGKLKIVLGNVVGLLPSLLCLKLLIVKEVTKLKIRHSFKDTSNEYL